MKELARKKDSNPYKHIRYKTSSDWYMYWLCEDKEFQDDMAAILEYASSRWTAMTDEEGAEFGRMVRDIQAKYNITEGEFEAVYAAYHHISNFDFPFRYIETKGDEVVIAIPGAITRDDYLEAWDEVEDMLIREEVRETNGSRRRSPDNTQLIYAIFKARKKGKKFSEIFTLYQDGQLDQYHEKSKTQYKSSDDLERYYNKYKPDR